MLNGMPNGMYNGQHLTQQVYVQILTTRTDWRTLSWTPIHTGALFHIIIDGELEAVTTDTSHDLPETRGGTAAIEIIETPTEFLNTNLQHFGTTPGDDYLLTWGASSGADTYYVYKHTSAGAITSGTNIAIISDSDLTEYSYVVENLDDDTWYLAVEARDEAGNTTDSNELNVTIDAPPEPPTGLTVTYTAAS